MLSSIKVEVNKSISGDLVLIVFALLSYSLFFTSVAKYAPLMLFPFGVLALVKYGYIRKTMRPFLVLVGLGVVMSSFSAEMDSYFLVKDLIFFTQVPVVIAFGYMIAIRKRMMSFFLTYMMLVSLGVLICHILIIFLYQREFLDNPLRFHDHYGTNSLNVILLLIVFKGLSDYTLWFNKRIVKNMFSFLILIYIFLSFSRTTIGIYLLVLLYGLVSWSIRRKIFLMIIAIPLLIQLYGPVSRVTLSEGDVTFIYKLQNSFSELQLKDFKSQKEITHFWRGYEGFLGLNKYSQGSIVQLLLGQGFGTPVSVPRSAFSDWTADGLEGLKRIAVFHIGYITLLLKTGFIGLLVYVWFLFRHLITNSKLQFSVNIMHSLVIYLLVTSFLTHGLFKADINPLILLLIGMSYGLERKKT